MTKIRKSSRTSLVGKHSLPSKCFRGAAGSVPCFSLLLNPTETLATQATVNITVKTAQARRKMAGGVIGLEEFTSQEKLFLLAGEVLVLSIADMV